VAAAAAVTVMAVLAAVFLARRGEAPVTEVQAPTIAVLPFENQGTVDDEFFVDGVTDEIIARLSNISGLGVISRRSAMHYKETDKTIGEIARELKVNYVLEGTVRWDRSASPERVRITPQLIRVSDDTNIWASTYERDMTDIFALQTDIATQVAKALDVTLMDRERQALASRPTQNMEAYQAFLRGVEQLDAADFSRESFELGVRMFERAVALDPGFALAYARLSEMHARMIHYGYDRSPERLSWAKAAVNRAFELDPELPEAWLALGYYYYWGRRDYDQALVALDTAQEHAPANEDIAIARAYVLRRQGDLRTCAAILERELERSPLDALATVALGETYSTLRRYEEAAAAFERAIELVPDEVYPYTELALVHLRWHGDHEAARQTLARVPTAPNAEFFRVGYLVDIFARDYPAAARSLRAYPEPVIEANAFYRPITLLEGMARQLEGQDGEALAAYRSARVQLEQKLAETPDDFRAHASLGLALAGLGLADQAVQHGERAVALYPLTRDALEAPVLINDLALVLTMTGDLEAALRRLDEVLSIPSIISVEWLRHDPRWAPLRENDGFEELLKRHER
jgi:TolB-like protein/Flp pilus assembly protein TadD